VNQIVLILSAFGHPNEFKMSRLMPLFASGAFVVSERMGCDEVCVPLGSQWGLCQRAVDPSQRVHSRPPPSSGQHYIVTTYTCRTWGTTDQG